jgi:hypothetical protein
LDDTLDKLETDRLSLLTMISECDTSEPDMLAKIEDLRRRHNPEQTAVWMRNLLTMARGNGNEDAKRRLMPIVRQLVQTVVIGKTPGHQPASLQVHGLIAAIFAQMDVMDLMEQQFIAAAQNDFVARIASGEIDTEDKRKKLLSEYAEELLKKFPEWENLQVLLVAGAGFEPAAFRL